jgi:hypothetical protein
LRRALFGAIAIAGLLPALVDFAMAEDNIGSCYEGQRGINCNCSQRATALGLHGEARIAFRDKCIAQLKAGLSPDADGRAK